MVNLKKKLDYIENKSYLKNFNSTALAGIIFPSLVTLLIWPLRQTLGSSSILMIYNLGVFLIAAHFGHRTSSLSALFSILEFSFFFAPPIFSFFITDLNNIISVIIMLAISYITSNMLDKIKLQSESAQTKEHQAVILYRLNKFLSNAANEDTLVHTAVINIYKDFKALSVLLIPHQNDEFIYPNDKPIKQSLRHVSLFVAKRVYKENLTLSPVIINNSIYFPLQGTKQRVGVIVMQRIQPKYTIFLETYLNQIALALERLNLANQAKEALLQADTEAARNALLSAISHDLRTPLTRIVGLSSTLIETDSLSDEERLDFNQSIHDEALRMSELMIKILDMAKLTSGKIVLKREWYALEKIIGGALTRLDSILDDRPVEILLPENLPLVWVDGVLLQQVLINLVENTVKYTPAASPIEIIVEYSFATFTLKIADYGPGIPFGMEEKIFDTFYRAYSESTLDGIGLGLSLCQIIIKAHQGMIWATNRPEGGAIFAIELPLPKAPLLNITIDPKECP